MTKVDSKQRNYKKQQQKIDAYTTKKTNTTIAAASRTKATATKQTDTTIAAATTVDVKHSLQKQHEKQKPVAITTAVTITLAHRIIDNTATYL